MKPLTLEETRLKEEMKERCLNKGQYIDENAKAKFDMLCHLEDFEIQYLQLQEENKQLKSQWCKLKEYIGTEWYCFDNESVEFEVANSILSKMQELEQGSDNDD